MTDNECQGAATDRDNNADEAVEAFHDLRHTVERLGAHISAEVTVVRKGVELAFEQFEKSQEVAQDGEDLAHIAEFLLGMNQRIDLISRSPILKNGPEYFVRALERGGEGMVATAIQQFELESREYKRHLLELRHQMQSARERRLQNICLWLVGAIGLVVGMVTALIAARSL